MSSPVTPTSSPRGMRESVSDLKAQYENKQIVYSAPSSVPSTDEHPEATLDPRTNQAAINTLTDASTSDVTVEKGHSDGSPLLGKAKLIESDKKSKDDNSDDEPKSCCQKITDFFCGCFKTSKKQKGE